MPAMRVARGSVAVTSPNSSFALSLTRAEPHTDLEIARRSVMIPLRIQVCHEIAVVEEILNVECHRRLRRKREAFLNIERRVRRALTRPADVQGIVWSGAGDSAGGIEARREPTAILAVDREPAPAPIVEE